MSQVLLSRNMLLIAAAVAIACQFPDIQIVPDENMAWLFDVRYVPNPALNRLQVAVFDLEIEVRLLLADIKATNAATVPRNTMQPLHTQEHPFCQHPECPCKDDHQLVQRFVMMPLETHQMSGNQAMAIYWGRAS
jgi:hypothetical protein